MADRRKASGEPVSRGNRKTLRARALATAAAIVSATALPTDVVAQGPEDNLNVARLPRPGYERRTIQLGRFILEPDLDLSAVAESNVFAAPDNEEEDVLFLVNPALGVSGRLAGVDFRTDVTASVRRYLETDQENIELFGATTVLQRNLGTTQKFSVTLGAQRDFERRFDPEANDNTSLPPTLINTVNGGFQYDYRPGRLGFSASANVRKTDFLRSEDADRDGVLYSGSIRGLVGISSRIDFFAETYAVARDFRTAFDRNGVNRDNLTVGGRSGIALDFTDTLQGDVGFGFFRATFDDAALEDFSGFGANGSLAWRPRTQTNVNLNFFRGDVATIRTGAQGRIDSTVGLNVAQEVRHNLIARANAGYRHRRFRTAANLTEEDVNAGAGLEYLINRYASVRADYAFTRRRGDNASEEFDAHRFGLTLSFNY